MTVTPADGQGPLAFVDDLDRPVLDAGDRHHLARVRAMSPQATLDRGYSILLDRDGAAVRSVDEVQVGEDLVAQLAEGQLVVEVLEQRQRGAS